MLRLGLGTRRMAALAPLWRAGGGASGSLMGERIGERYGNGEWKRGEQRMWGTTLRTGTAAGGAPPRTKRGFGLHAKDKKKQRERDVRRKRAAVKQLREKKKEEELMDALRIATGDDDSEPHSLSPDEADEDDPEMELSADQEAADRLHDELREQFPDMVTVDDDEIAATASLKKDEIDRLSAELEEQYKMAELELREEEAKVGEVEALFYPHELIERLKKVKDVEELIDVDLGFAPEEYRQMLEEEHAEDIVVIDISKKCNFAKWIIICSTQSTRHRLAIAEKLRLQIQKRKQILMPHMLEEGRCLLEGSLPPLPPEQSREWISVDGDTVLVNLFSPERRAYYDLETFWNTEAEELLTDEEMVTDIIENHDLPDKKKAKGASGNRKKKGKKKKK